MKRTILLLLALLCACAVAAAEPASVVTTGAGVSVQPMGFLVISQNQVRLAPAQYVAPLDHLMELVPQLIGEVRRLFPAKQPAQ